MRTSRRKTAIAAAAATCLLLAPPVQAAVLANPAPTDPAPTSSPAPEAAPGERDTYTVPGTDVAQRTEITRTGAQVLAERGGTATVEATGAQAEQLRGKGLVLQHRENVGQVLDRIRPAGEPGDFPPDDRGYHTYDETNAELDAAVRDHPGTAAKTSIGKTFEGRDIPAVKISDNADRDEDEPEVLFDCNQHAREHLTTEMCLRIVNRFTDGTDDPAIRDMVDNHEIWVVPMVNVDGSVHDVATGQYQGWRKNRQGPGTDLNRNWGHEWACCGGSSDDPQDETYHGTGPFSAPATDALKRFVDSRVVDGRQQIKTNIDFHTYSELVMWPFGYTQDQVTDGMTREEYDRFARVGTEIADTNGYTPQQSSGLYITDGDILDWEWARHKILGFTLEMYPKEGGIDGFYPPDEVIERETARNDAAVDRIIRESDA